MKIDKNGYLIYKGIKLDITQKQIYEIQDFFFQHLLFLSCNYVLYRKNV